MNAFKILDNKGNAISINKLDKEVCEMMGAEVDNKHYCRLGKREEFDESIKGELDYLFHSPNWYDTIGWLIASEGLSFEGIIDYLKKDMKHFLGTKDEDGSIITIEDIYPHYMQVLNTWIEKGYKAVQILEEELA